MKTKSKKLNIADKLWYHGDVTLKICDNNTIISTKTFKNAGTRLLSHFLCLCLSGNYEGAKNIRPFKIRIYSHSGSADTAINNLVSAVPCMGSYMSMDTLPIINEITDQNGEHIIGYSTTLHFLIPYTYIQTEQSDKLNQICLYGIDIKQPEDYKKYMASVLLRKESGGTYTWDPIDIPATSKNNYNLIVEWTMKFELDQAAEEDYED